jgi:hypothetical protein
VARIREDVDSYIAHLRYGNPFRMSEIVMQVLFDPLEHGPSTLAAGKRREARDMLQQVRALARNADARTARAHRASMEEIEKITEGRAPDIGAYRIKPDTEERRQVRVKTIQEDPAFAADLPKKVREGHMQVHEHDPIAPVSKAQRLRWVADDAQLVCQDAERTHAAAAQEWALRTGTWLMQVEKAVFYKRMGRRARAYRDMSSGVLYPWGSHLADYTLPRVGDLPHQFDVLRERTMVQLGPRRADGRGGLSARVARVVRPEQVAAAHLFFAALNHAVADAMASEAEDGELEEQRRQERENGHRPGRGSDQHGRRALGSGKTAELQQRTRELRSERQAEDAVRRKELRASGYSSMSCELILPFPPPHSAVRHRRRGRDGGD